ncbi:isoleucine--tRNA ligase [Thiotrichales bacterium 19S11-10]|nr:isoleucine--tRNA ligase [Thiotrichales bacterium 19S11-10]
MTDYKETLNLPNTSFAMRGNLAQQEPKRLKKWQQTNLYQNITQHTKGRKQFILHDGPPYANGDIHVGHAVNKILKDIILKSKRLDGFDSPYIPGWDCHGLPIEVQIEKKLGKPGIKVDANTFRKECRKFALKQVERQKNDFIRLGILGDWDNPYLTMDYQYEADTIRNLAKIVKNGHLTKGFKPVHWCFDCRSSLSEAEIEYKDKESPSIDVKFYLSDYTQWKDKLSLEKLPKETSVVIWTTTPWTLPANQGIAYGLDIDYVILELTESNEAIIIAEALMQSVLDRVGIAQTKIIKRFKGSNFEGLSVKHPLYDKVVPMLEGHHVSTESGTGLVHTAPAHGVDDFAIGKKYQLPLENPVNGNGCYIQGTELFEGQFVFKANQHIINILAEKSTLLYTDTFMHSYPHCWRHKSPVIFRATPQWFISMDNEKLRTQTLNAAQSVNWLPKSGEKRFLNMIETRPDWCISRQRTWNTPITLFIHKETGKLHPNTDQIFELVAKKVSQSGIEAWFNSSDREFIGDDINQYERVSDTLDVWFDSGSSNFCVLEKRPELSFPADLYLEGSDQHRGWFQTSMLSAIAREGKAPYNEVITHGFTVDKDGRKMSKSLGNVISPQDIVKELGADILRLWVASVDYHSEMTISKEILKRTSDTYRRIRNTARFLLANLSGFNPETDQVSFEQMVALDRWAVARTNEIQSEIINAYEHYQFHNATQAIHHFCSIDMGSFYLDIIKDRQYTTKENSIARRSAQSAMYHIIQALVRWISPVLSFTADEIWDSIPGDKAATVFITKWYDKLSSFNENEKMNLAFWQEIMPLRDLVNVLIEEKRNQNQLGSSLEAEITLYANGTLFDKLMTLEDELRFALITSKATVKPYNKAPKELLETEIEGIKIEVTPTNSPKCQRCWHRRDDIGSNANYPDLCQRCVTNITSKEGEIRHYA